MAATPTQVTANASNAPDSTVMPAPISSSSSTLDSLPIASHSTPAAPTSPLPSIHGAHDPRPALLAPSTPPESTFDAPDFIIPTAPNSAPAGSTSEYLRVPNAEHDSVLAPTPASALAPQSHPSPTHSYPPSTTATQPTFGSTVQFIGSTINHTRDQINNTFFQYINSKTSWSTQKKKTAAKAATYLLIAVILAVIVAVGFGAGVGVGVGKYKRPSSPASGLTNITQESLSEPASSPSPGFTLNQSSASISAMITSIIFTETVIVNTTPTMAAPQTTDSVSPSTNLDNFTSILTFTFTATIGTGTIAASSSLLTLGTPESPPVSESPPISESPPT